MKKIQRLLKTYALYLLQRIRIQRNNIRSWNSLFEVKEYPSTFAVWLYVILRLTLVRKYTMYSRSFITWAFIPKCGWIRVFGYGIYWKDIKIYGMMFSERFGHHYQIVIGHWLFEFLPRVNYNYKST